MPIHRNWSRARRNGNRVVRDYVGPLTDEVANFIYKFDNINIEAKKGLRKIREAERNWYSNTEAEIIKCLELVRKCVSFWLRDDGLGISQNWTLVGAKTRMNKGVRNVAISMTRKDFEELVVLAENGHEKAIESLKSIISADRESWSKIGDLSNHIKMQFISLLTKGNLVAKEALLAQLFDLVKNLNGGPCSPVRQLVVDQVVNSWLDLHYQHLLASEPREEKTQTDFWERRLDRAQKRYLRTVRTLSELDAIKAKTD
jgi:hypothetical protein